jgi:hypothetical protein
LASIVQVPAWRKLTVEPSTVHTDGVAEDKETGSPEEAVAVSS